MKIADLFVKIGLDGAGDVTKGLGKVTSGMKDLFSMSIQTKLTLAGIVGGLTMAAKSAGATGQELMHFKYAFGLSIQELQKWQYAATGFGVKGEEIRGTIENIQNEIIKAKTGGGFSEVFGKLGIDITKNQNAFDVLLQMQDKIKKGNVDVARLFSSGLISPEVFQFLKRAENMATYKAPKGAIYSDAQVARQEQIAVKFDRFGNDLKKDLDRFVVDNSKFILEAMQTLKEVLQSILKFFADNKDVIIKFTNAVMELVKALLQFTGGAINPTGRVEKDASGKIIEKSWAKRQGENIFDFFKSGAEQKEKFLKERSSNSRGPSSESSTNNYYINGVDVNERLQDTSKRDIMTAAIAFQAGAR